MLSFILIALICQVPDEYKKWAEPPAGLTDSQFQGVLRFAIFAEKERGQQVGEAARKIQELRKAVPVSGPARAKRLSEIKDAQLHRDLLVAGVKFPIPLIRSAPPFAGSYIKGQVGRLADEIHVLQVVNGVVVAHVGVRTNEIIIQGMDVTQIADGDSFLYAGFVECIGTTQHTTVTGATRSLYTFKKFEHADVVQEWEWMRIQNYAEWGGPARK